MNSKEDKESDDMCSVNKPFVLDFETPNKCIKFDHY